MLLPFFPSFSVLPRIYCLILVPTLYPMNNYYFPAVSLDPKPVPGTIFICFWGRCDRFIPCVVFICLTKSHFISTRTKVSLILIIRISIRCLHLFTCVVVFDFFVWMCLACFELKFSHMVALIHVHDAIYCTLFC